MSCMVHTMCVLCCSSEQSHKGEIMSNTFKTIAQFATESGISQARVRKLLDDVRPEIKLGNSVGYHPDALKSALINRLSSELRYLEIQDYAANILAGYGPQDA